MKTNVSMSLCMSLLAITVLLSGCGKTCDIKLKNGAKGIIKVLTKTPDSSGNIVENATDLQPGEELKIGQCTDCAALEGDEIHVTAMLIVLGTDELELKDKNEIIKFLGELKSDGCVVKIFE